MRNKVPPGHEILFVPDKHLGRYLQDVTGREMILWDGSCMVHEIFSVGDLLKMKKQAPAGEDDRASRVSREHTASTADFVGGTEAMVKHVGTSRSRRSSWSPPKRT